MRRFLRAAACFALYAMLTGFLVSGLAPAGLRVGDPHHLTLGFSGPVDTASITTRDVYITPGYQLAQSLTFNNDSTITLYFTPPLQPGSHELVISALRGADGSSPILPLRLPFTLYSEAAPGDVLISEFLPDPPAGQPEFVELYNKSGEPQNLAGWRFGDRTGLAPITSDTLALDPGHYLVLTPDAAALQAVYGAVPVHEMSGFPALNNGGDLLQLALPDGRLSDSLVYASSWVRADTSLERRSTGTVSTYRENWAPSPVGATPGRANAVEPDETAPMLESLVAVDDRRLMLHFNETLGTAPPHEAISLDPPVPLSAVSVSANSLEIKLASGLQSNLDYTIRLSAVQDLFGNTAALEYTFRYLRLANPRPGEIVINEFLSDPAAAGAGEFVELLNTSDYNFSLKGWSFGDARQVVPLRDGGASGTEVLEAHTRLVLTADAALASALDSVLYLPGMPALNNDGDILRLYRPDGLLLDSLAYDSGWKLPRHGTSLERLDPVHPSNDPSNWRPSAAPGYHTAGKPNSRRKADREAPHILMASLNKHGLISVYFSEFVRYLPQMRWRLQGQELQIAYYDSTRADSWLFEAPANFSAPGELTLEALFLQDFNGNRAENLQLPLAHAPASGELVLNEILFDPLQDARDGRPDQCEYLEYVNLSGHALSLEGLWLHDAPDEKGKVSGLIPEGLKKRWLPAGGYLLFYADTASFFRTGRINRAFQPGDSAYAFKVDQLSLGLSTEGETVLLADSSGRTIDSVRYQPGWHNPNLPDTKGLALERINPDSEADRASSWGSSSAAAGGTPGRANSILQQPETTDADAVLQLAPNPFSPDGDGHDDRLLLHYQLDQPDYLLRVRIFDRYGHRVRTLADGRAAGAQGVLAWDGLTDAGRNNRIGIYIVLFEAYDSFGGQGQSFKKTVVLARRL